MLPPLGLGQHRRYRTGRCALAMDNVNFNGPISSVNNWNTWVSPELEGRVAFRPMCILKLSFQGTTGTTPRTPTNRSSTTSTSQSAPVYLRSTLQITGSIKCFLFRAQKGKRFVGPLCSDDAAGQAWLQDFMDRTFSEAPDYFGLHHYGTNGNAVSQLFLDLHAKCPNQPIVISEIASIARDLPVSLASLPSLRIGWTRPTGSSGMVFFVVCVSLRTTLSVQRPS